MRLKTNSGIIAVFYLLYTDRYQCIIHGDLYHNDVFYIKGKLEDKELKEKIRDLYPELVLWMMKH